MLSVNDLIGINYIPTETDISLQLLVDFYESYLCKRIFIFTLRNGRVIKLFFRDATELFHVSGIEHIYEGVPMDGTRFLQDIKAGNIDLKTVQNVNSAAYKDFEIRIRSMACIDTIIKNCEYLWYSTRKIPDSTIEVKYLLLKGLDGKNLHLGIDTYNEKRPYFTRTLLVTEGNAANKFINKADERLRVSKLEIRDKDTDHLLDYVDRKQAEQVALGEVKSYTENWLSKNLPILISDHSKATVDNEVFEAWIQGMNYEVLQKICIIEDNLKTAFEMKDELGEKQSWLKLLLGELGDNLSDREFVRKMICTTLNVWQNYEKMLSNSIRTVIRKAWISIWRKNIEQNKSVIRAKVDSLDAYLSGKIVAEAIRKFDKEELEARMTVYIKEYISHEGRNVVTNILEDKILNNKESVLGKVMLMFK